MKLITKVVALVVAVCTFGAVAQPANQPPEEVQALFKKVSEKIQAGKPSEEGLKAELAEFDELAAKFKSEKPEEAARVLFMKGLLYMQVLDNTDKTKEVLQVLKKEYPETQAGKNVDQVLAGIEKQGKAKAIQAELVVGKTFPAFQVKDLEGKPLSLSNYKGKVVLLDFWATWCGPCVAELPSVLDAYQKHHAKGFEIIGISLDQDEEKLKKFIKDKEMPWAQYFDGKGWENALGEKYGIRSIPATFLLDGEGKIIGRDLRGEELEKAVANALAKK